MGFIEFITSAWYRRRAFAAFERYQKIKPPANPSRRYIDRLVRRLLSSRTAWNARRELEMIGSAAVPSLVAALSDSRFHRAEWGEEQPLIPAPLELTLGLLVDHAPAEVIQIAAPLAGSPSCEVRKAVASSLASTGRVSVIATLRKLINDENGYVRSAVVNGIHSAVIGLRAEEKFRARAYDLLLEQCTLHWHDNINDSADTIVIVDPVRAKADLGQELYLNLANPCCYQIVEACLQAKIHLPEPLIRKLLDTALPGSVGAKSYPNDYVAAAALKSLALQKAVGTEQLAVPLLDHENEKVREAAAESLAILANISDPIGIVIKRVRQHGYPSLSQPQRVVYCAFKFDAEVCNGGLMQFFGNSSGDYAADTLAALRELGHQEGTVALESAMKHVGRGVLIADREKRLSAFEGRWEELEALFDPLESAYYPASGRLRQAWWLYAVRHIEDFRD